MFSLGQTMQGLLHAFGGEWGGVAPFEGAVAPFPLRELTCFARVRLLTRRHNHSWMTSMIFCPYKSRASAFGPPARRSRGGRRFEAGSPRCRRPRQSHATAPGQISFKSSIGHKGAVPVLLGGNAAGQLGRCSFREGKAGPPSSI